MGYLWVAGWIEWSPMGCLWVARGCDRFPAIASISIYTQTLLNILIQLDELPVSQ